MKKILKYLIITAICAAAAFAMTACVKDYGREDVKRYIFDELGLKNISLSKEPEDIFDGEYHDKLWSVTDKDNNVDFYVLDDRTWGMETATNRLENDYYAEYFLKFYDDANIKSKYVEVETEGDLLQNVTLSGEYSDLYELEKIYDELKQYYDFFLNKRADIEIAYDIKYDYPLRYIGDNDVVMGDLSGIIRPSEFSKEIYNNALKRYYEVNLVYYFEDKLKDADNRILREIINDKDTYRICKKSGEEVTEIYDDIIANPYAYGISFGTMYKIFEKEGFPLSGTPAHYKVTAPNGDMYEFSYDFNDMAYPDSDANDGYYYYKNGIKTAMDYPFYYYFRSEALNEMFGLNIDDGLMKWLTDKEN